MIYHHKGFGYFIPLWPCTKIKVTEMLPFVCWLLNVPATCYMLVYLWDRSAQFYMLQNWEAVDQTFYLIQSQYTDTGPTSPSADPITPDAWQGSHWSGNFEVTGMTQPRKKSCRKRTPYPPGQRGGPIWGYCLRLMLTNTRYLAD